MSGLPVGVRAARYPSYEWTHPAGPSARQEPVPLHVKSLLISRRVRPVEVLRDDETTPPVAPSTIRSLLLPRYFDDAHLMALDHLDGFTTGQGEDSIDSACLGHQHGTIDYSKSNDDGGGGSGGDNRVNVELVSASVALDKEERYRSVGLDMGGFRGLFIF